MGQRHVYGLVISMAANTVAVKRQHRVDFQSLDVLGNLIGQQRRVPVHAWVVRKKRVPENGSQ